MDNNNNSVGNLRRVGNTNLHVLYHVYYIKGSGKGTVSMNWTASKAEEPMLVLELTTILFYSTKSQ